MRLGARLAHRMHRRMEGPALDGSDKQGNPLRNRIQMWLSQ